MLPIEEIQHIAEKILVEALGAAGYDGVSIRSGVDHDGEPALFIEANLSERTPVVSGSVYGSALGALRRALLQRDEDRFPYLALVRREDRDASKSLDKSARRKARRAHG
jgi:hypothetical protein